MPALFDVLRQQGVTLEASQTRIVRHKDRRYDVADIIRRGLFEHYQCVPEPTALPQCRYVLPFLGEAGTRARVLGLYAVEGEEASSARRGRLVCKCPPAIDVAPRRRTPPARWEPASQRRRVS